MSFACPVCGAVSHNVTDEREGYCARCHDFTGMVEPRSGGRTRPMYWVLDDEHNPVPATLYEWGAMFEDPTRRFVDYTEFHVAGRDGKVKVSTVFLGIDHSFGFRGPPVLFESMVFAADGEGYDTRRYCTWAEAEVGHKALVAGLMARYVVAAVEDER